MRTFSRTFAPSSERKTIPFCPCGKSNKDEKFSPLPGYTDKGKCHACGKFFSPDSEKPYQQKAKGYASTRTKLTKPTIKQEPIHTIPDKIFSQSFDKRQNFFLRFLALTFGIEVTNKLREAYFVGTSDKWKGATVFWYIDAQKRIRSGKIMLYHADSGKRVKEPYNHVSWIHTEITDYKYSACLFGEHLLHTDQQKPIAIVESEKSAIIASMYLPKYLWLATGSKDGLKPEHLASISKRKIVLYPDNDGFAQWSGLADKLRKDGWDISTNRILYDSKEQGQEKYDIADYLLRIPYQHTDGGRADDQQEAVNTQAKSSEQSATTQPREEQPQEISTQTTTVQEAGSETHPKSADQKAVDQRTMESLTLENLTFGEELCREEAEREERRRQEIKKEQAMYRALPPIHRTALRLFADCYDMSNSELRVKVFEQTKSQEATERICKELHYKDLVIKNFDNRWMLNRNEIHDKMNRAKYTSS